MPQRVEGNIEIEAPVETVYGYWETLENLPNFMANVEEVTPTGPDTTHWRVKGPLGKTLEWDAQTTQKEHNSAIAWNSTQGDVGTSGQVRFLEAGQPERTRVEVQMNYADPPGGKVGEVASRAIANPKLQLEQDLRNLKQILEGEATPEDIQRRPAATTVQSGVVAFLTSGAGREARAASPSSFSRKPKNKGRFHTTLPYSYLLATKPPGGEGGRVPPGVPVGGWLRAALNAGAKGPDATLQQCLDGVGCPVDAMGEGDRVTARAAAEGVSVLLGPVFFQP